MEPFRNINLNVKYFIAQIASLKTYKIVSQRFNFLRIRHQDIRLNFLRLSGLEFMLNILV